MQRVRIVKLFVSVCCAVCLLSCGSGAPTDMQQRGRADGLLRRGFLLRYRAPQEAVEYAEAALQYINDSLPTYHDGRLRAWNLMAFNNYMLSRHELAAACVDSVLCCNVQSNNAEVERVIALLLKARLEQRSCRIADSYRTLYEVDHSRVLQRSKGNYLYAYAQMEYYVTTLTLNYHYRHGALNNVRLLLPEVEHKRSELQCDDAEDLELNYALAYSYAQLCDTTRDQAVMLDRMLQYCEESLRILSNPSGYTDFAMANIVQLLAFVFSNEHIAEQSWQDCMPRLEAVGQMMERILHEPLLEADDATLALFDVSVDLFALTTDSYQQLGAAVAAGHYCLSVGDTAGARYYYRFGLDGRDSLTIAPKFDALLFEGLIRTGCQHNDEELRGWFDEELATLNYIQQNEKADFLLQHSLERSHNKARSLSVVAAVATVVALLLLGLLLLLRRRTLALRREKELMQQAKRTDVERIANIETCLSVMRHDITPFISYLHSPNLPAELRVEVMDQLLRTFENIKNWTNLSIPNGLQFTGSTFSLQEVLDEVERELGALVPQGVVLRMEPTPLRVNADRLLLQILLRNLVNNALQHTSVGSVEVRAERQDNFVCLSVVDTGCGMTAEELEQLFRSDKPLRETSPRASHGSGFGLILCRYIIKKHDDNTLRGCRIWAESEVGKGSTFRCLIAAAPGTDG